MWISMNGKAFIVNFALPFVQHAPHHIKYDTLLCLKRLRCVLLLQMAVKPAWLSSHAMRKKKKTPNLFQEVSNHRGDVGWIHCSSVLKYERYLTMRRQGRFPRFFRPANVMENIKLIITLLIMGMSIVNMFVFLLYSAVKYYIG